MKKRTITRYGKASLIGLVCLALMGCTFNAEIVKESGASERSEQSANLNEPPEESEKTAEQDEPEEMAEEKNRATEEKKHTLVPMKYQWQEGDMDYDPEDTIYYKTYYDDFVRGKIQHIEYPDINIKGELEEYFLHEDDFEKWDNLVEMFFDYRTIEMPEEELKSLFYKHGYSLCLQSTEMKDLHVRFVEITEIGGLSLYPTRIMIQTWDEDHIYLQNITSPIPRKIMSIFSVDNREPYHMVVHSSGLSRDYIDEQELSFWEYRGTYWALVPMDLEIDTSHAHISGENFYPDMDRDELFEAFYYRDGIAYRPSRQNDHAVNTYTVKLGKMEEVEKNRIFRLMAVYESEELGATEWPSDTYIQFEIKQDLLFIPRECRYNSGGAFLYYLQLSGMEDKEKEKRLNALLYDDIMKILEGDDPYPHLDYEIEHMDKRTIRILYKNRQGETVMTTTLDIEEERILSPDGP